MLTDAQFSQKLSAFSQQPMLSTTALLGLGAIALYSLKAVNNSKEKNLPPLVKYTFPIIGNTIEYMRDPRSFLAKCTEQYGPVFRVNVLGSIQTFVGKDSVRDVFLDDNFSFNAAIRDIIDFSSLLTGDSSTTHNIISTSVTPNIPRFIPIVVPYLIQEMDRVLDVGQDSVKTPSRKVIEKMVSRAISRIFVGPELCNNDELIEIFRSFADDVGAVIRRIGGLAFMPNALSMTLQKMIFSISNPIARHKNMCVKHLVPEIDRRRREMAELGDRFERPDDVMQSVAERFPEWSSKKIAMYMLDFAFVSIDTTSRRSEIILTAFATYPQYIPELLEEQEEVLSAEPPNEYGTPYTMGALKKMVKLDSFIRESLRCQPLFTVALPHKNVSDGDLVLSNGVKVSKGESVSMNLSDIQSVEGESPSDPIKFNPWRYVGKNENIARVGPEYLVFGLGKHACPGRWLAAAELKTIAALFLARYDVTFAEPQTGSQLLSTTQIFEFRRK